MFCKNSDKCIYYRNYRYKSCSKQFKLLAESYCEGALQEKCRRLHYEKEFGKVPPENLAPNGYIVGTHKKLRIENTRKHKRYEVKNSVCLLQVPDTKKTFSAWFLDVSQGGVKIAVKTSPQDLDSEPGVLQILGHNTEDLPLPLTEELVQIIWSNNQVIGCSFVPTPV